MQIVVLWLFTGKRQKKTDKKSGRLWHHFKSQKCKMSYKKKWSGFSGAVITNH
jgi:hypothetical protein